MLSQPLAMNIRYDWNGFSVSYKESREALHAYFPGRLEKKLHDDSKAITHEAIGKMARQGDQLMALETGYTVVDQTREDTQPREVDVNVMYLPRPHVTYEPNRLAIEATPRGSIADLWG